MKSYLKIHALGRSLFLLVVLFSISLGLAFPAAAQARVQSVYRQYFLNLPNKTPDAVSGYRTTLYLRNTGVTSVVVNLEFSNSSTGQWVTTVPYSIQPAATIERPLEYTGLPAGIYNLAITSDGPIEGVARLIHGNGDQLAVFSGLPDLSAGLVANMMGFHNLNFGPFFQNSFLILQNQGSAAANFTVALYDGVGAMAQMLNGMINPGGTNVVSATLGLPVGVYFAIVSSDQPLTGCLRTAAPAHTDFEIQPALGTGSMAATLPRALKTLDEGGGSRTTHLFIANAGNTAAADITVTYSDGTATYTHSGLVIPVSGFKYLNLAAEAMLPSATSFAVTVTSASQPIVLGEMTDLDSAPYATSSAAYAGIGSGSTADLPYLVRNGQDFSILSVQNLGATDASVSIQFNDLSGAPVYTRVLTMVKPGAAGRINLHNLTQLGDTFTGGAVVTATGPIATLVDVFTPSCSPPSNVIISPDSAVPLIAGDTAGFTASASGDAPFHYAWTLDTTPITGDASHQDIPFTAAGSPAIGVTVSNICGQADGSLPVTVQALTVIIGQNPAGDLLPGAPVIFTATTNSSASFDYAWVVDGVPVGSNTTTYDSFTAAPGSYSVGVTMNNSYAQAYASQPVTVQPFTVAITRTPTGDLYPGDPVEFIATTNSSGALNYAWTVDGFPAGGNSSTFDTSYPAAGSHTIAVKASTPYMQASATLDVEVKEYSVTISRLPAGDVFVGDTVEFTATPGGGTTPFTYTWTWDGHTYAGPSNTFSITFTAPGDYWLGLSIINQYGIAINFTTLKVKPYPPDLSTSTMTVDHPVITSLGETLTYTISLKNTGLGNGQVNLSDAIPFHTALVPGSLATSDGSQVTISPSGILSWDVNVPYASQVTLTYQVVAQDFLIGDTITNIAHLLYGPVGAYDQMLDLPAETLYNPGFSFSILNGALATNHNPVSLSYTWDATRNITHVRFSNDGGFGSGINTSGWLPVDKANPTYPAWTLAYLPDTLMPRTVYVQFKDASAHIYGPFQDDIIFDAVPPQVTSVEILPAGKLSYAPLGASVTVRVHASDDNSGVGRIEISDTVDFLSFSEFPATGAITDIPWVLGASGNVYVVVVDRAGNASPISLEHGLTYQVFLPSVRH